MLESHSSHALLCYWLIKCDGTNSFDWCTRVSRFARSLSHERFSNLIPNAFSMVQPGDHVLNMSRRASFIGMLPDLWSRRDAHEFL